MDCKWEELLACEYCDSVRDGTHDTPKPSVAGYKLITSKHITNGFIDLESAYAISEEDYVSINKRSKVDLNDILISMIGTVGRVVRVNIEPDFAIKNIGLFKIRDELKSKWLYYWLQSPQSKQYLEASLAGSTQAYISLARLREWPVRHPTDFDEMTKIANVLTCIDKKIECNKRINDYLAESTISSRATRHRTHSSAERKMMSMLSVSCS